MSITQLCPLRMTREEVMRAGGVFRSDVQKAPHDIRKGDVIDCHVLTRADMPPGWSDIG